MFRVLAILTSLVAVAAFAPRGFVSRSSLQMANIVETAVGAGSFNTLVAAVKAAGLADTLSGPGKFTVFAPTDAAFAKLPAGTVDALLKDIPKLKSILLYHVIGKEVKPTKNGLNFETLSVDEKGLAKELGCKLKIVAGKRIMDPSTEDSYIFSGAATPARVEAFSVKADNGLIHVIDNVLIPYEGSFQPWMKIKEGFGEF